MVGRRLHTHRRAIEFIRNELKDYEKDYSWQLDQASTLYYVWRKWWLRILLAENLERSCNSYYISNNTFDKLLRFALTPKDVSDYHFTWAEKIGYFWGDVSVLRKPLDDGDIEYTSCSDIYEDHL